MKNTFVKSVQVPAGARRVTLQDTQEIVQGQTEVNFFPAQADRDATRNNYVSNPLPGEDGHMIVGISFELTAQFLENDAANGIDVEKIINGLKDSGFIITADSDYKEFMRAPLSQYFNFGGTGLQIRLAAASNAGGDALVTSEEKTATIKSAPMFNVPNPFFIAPNQTFDLKLVIQDASGFPTAQNWVDAGLQNLALRSTLFAAKITPAMRKQLGY